MVSFLRPCLRILKGHTEWIQCVAFSPDGQGALMNFPNDRLDSVRSPIGLQEVLVQQEARLRAEMGDRCAGVQKERVHDDHVAG